MDHLELFSGDTNNIEDTTSLSFLVYTDLVKTFYLLVRMYTHHHSDKLFRALTLWDWGLEILSVLGTERFLETFYFIN